MRANQILFLAVLSIGVVTTSEKPALAQAEEGLVLKVYDVGDLVMDVRDYEYPGSEFGKNYVPAGFGGGGMGGGGFGGGGGGFGGGGGGGFGGGGGQFQVGGGGRPSAASTLTTMDDLLNVLYSVIDHSSWRENGGSAEAKPFGNSLVVSQTPEIHAQIEQLLKQLRTTSGERRSISIDARWLLLSSDELDLLVQGGNGATVNREALAEFTRRPRSIRAVTSCFSGQLVYVVSGTKRNVVSGYIPVVGSLDEGESAAQLASSHQKSMFRFVSDTQSAFGSRGSVGYQPLVEKQNIGALLEIRPSLIQGSNAAVVDLKATVTDSGESVDGAEQAAAPGPPEVDRVSIQTQELATTLRVPLGEPVLVGGMTNVSSSEIQGGGESPQLYLVLEVR